ncbi:MAG: Rv1355c family protein [Bacteroidia bacterium]|nr:Rv1355c family protein [Bacteroidia bacterium]
MIEYTPTIISAASGGQGKEILEKIRKTEGILIFDEIEGQLRELVKTQNPKTDFKQNPEKYQHFIEDYLSGTPLEEVGNWVYYPWRNTLVHVLAEEEFALVRTNRNKYKITDSEQNLLATKKVGVIGLSVGQSVALTMAMERNFGEIRLADFDEIELSNLNRIRSGVFNLGVNKAISVAREIAEIDPYLDVKVFEEGITEENLDAFFTEGGQLDALVEECDGLDIKIIARNKAKSLGIPVIMETNDRAMLDIERFDTEPDRPILHGLVKGLDVEILKTLKTNEDKVPYMLDMISIDETSVMLRASMLEIEQSIATWPQLASSVVFGGGLVSSAVRRILLGKNVQSGRYYNDFEQVGEPSTDRSVQYFSDKQTHVPDYDEVFQRFEISAPPNSVSLDETTLDQIVADILQAPSAANNQPWKWLYKNNHLILFHHVIRGAAFWDQEHLGAALGLGCALSNLRISAVSNGLKPHVNIQPGNLGQPDKPIAEIWFEHADSDFKHPLYDQIYTRRTNRLNVVSEPIEDQEIEVLKSVLDDSEFQLHVVTDSQQKEAIAEVMGKVEQIRMLNPNGHRDYVKEVRWTDEEAQEKRDGIDIGTINLTASEKAGLVISKDEFVIEKLRDWDGGDAFIEMITKGVNMSAGICFIVGERYDNEAMLEAGEVFEDLWLTIAKHELEIHPLTSVAILFNLAHNQQSVMSDTERSRLLQLNLEFNSLLGIDNSKHVFMAFRLSKCENSDITSYRFNKNESFARG